MDFRKAYVVFHYGNTQTTQREELKLLYDLDLNPEEHLRNHSVITSQTKGINLISTSDIRVPYMKRCYHFY